MMATHTFFCIDGHTCGNPVRIVAGGGPPPRGDTASDRRLHFMAEHDWIRRALMFEPRGHDMMSGSLLYPPTRDDCDAGILFIETSGCLPMCGHGTIGTVTFALERGLIQPRTPGVVRLDTPAGVVTATYDCDGPHVTSVRITNVPAFLAADNLTVQVPGYGPLTADIAYGGNFYAIIEPQPGFDDLAGLSAGEIIRLSPLVRAAFNEALPVEHPDNPAIRGLSHVMWTGRPSPAAEAEAARLQEALPQAARPQASQPQAAQPQAARPAPDPGGSRTVAARNAVFYGDKAIDRSPCGTGTSARMAQWAARGDLAVGDGFVHESIIKTLFHGRVEAATTVGHGAATRPAIVPSISGWARMTGLNTIFVDDRDPLWRGFQV